MTKRSATPHLPANVVAGLITIDVATAAAGVEGPPEWIKVTPRGLTTCRDGRVFTFAPERLVSRFAADGIDVPVDLDHAISRKAFFGDRADAFAWVKELEAREDGTYARVEWLPTGKAVLDAKTHRYVSPTFHHDEAGYATWLHSVALVAAPALAMPALADANSSTETTMLKAVVQALGLTEGEDEAACLSALKTRLECSVAKTVHDEALSQLSAVSTQLKTLQSEARKAKVEGVIGAALSAKKILPAEREHYTALCATDDGLAAVEKLFAARAPGLAPSSLDAQQHQEGQPGGDDPVALAAAACDLQDKERTAGRTISMAEAMTRVQAQKAAA